MEGIGPLVSASVRMFFEHATNRGAIDRVLARGVTPSPPEVPTGTALKETKFVFTGGLEGLSRSDARSRVEGAGGKVVSSVSKETDYLVLGTDPGSKYEKAIELGVEVLDETAFISLIDRVTAEGESPGSGEGEER